MTPAQFWAIESQNQQNKMARMDALANQVGSGAGRLASAAVGFAMGGPAGAAMAAGGGDGGILGNIIGSYTQKEQDKSDAKIYGNLMKIIAPAFGKDGAGILQTFNELESDAERANFGRTIAGSLGTIGNMYAQTRSAGIRQDQQALTAAMPRARAVTQAQAQVAAGQGTMAAPSTVNFDFVR